MKRFDLFIQLAEEQFSPRWVVESVDHRSCIGSRWFHLLFCPLIRCCIHGIVDIRLLGCLRPGPEAGHRPKN
jgi:hypothetical protein